MIIIPFLQNSFAQGYKIGDLYESPDGSQGVVFFVFPNGQGGWVVALSDASNGCTWGSTADIHGLTNLNPQWSHQLLADTAGYTNTSIIRNFQNSNQYAAGVVDFENGWYLPSAAQLSLLYSQLPIISPIIVSLGGNDLADDSYWCSTEYSDGRAYQVNFGLNTPWTGLLSSANKSTLCRVRAVRSFSYSEDPISVSYSWSTGDTTPDITVSPDQTTIYTLTVTTAGGCVDTVQHTIVVNVPVGESINAIACDSYAWNGTTYYESGDYTYAHLDANGCTQVDTLHLTVHYGTHNVVDTVSCGSYAWNGMTCDTSGTYTYEYTNTDGCPSVDTLHLTVIPPPTLSHTLDTVIIAGTSANLWASGADYLYWTDSNDNVLYSGSTLTINPLTSTTYYINGQNYSDGSNNLVVNGDFEQGNVNFISDYLPLTSQYMSYGHYTVTTDGYLHFLGTHLYGYNGTGKFMLVDGATTLNTVVWQQTVPVTPHTYYAFSAQVASTHHSNASGAYALLQFSVNSNQLGDIFHSPNVLNVWRPYYEVWYSGENTTATLSILNQNTSLTGNDFGIDEITFYSIMECTVTDTILVQVTGYPDNVDSADCVFFPEGTEWEIGEPMVSETLVSMCSAVPMVGDVDDDGQQEIVMHTDSQVLIFNDDATLKTQFNVCQSRQEGQLGLAKVRYQSDAFQTIIVVYSTVNKYLYAYDASGNQLWQSSQPFGSYNGESYQLPAISFADFNHDGWTEIFVGSEIFDAATGVFLGKTDGNKGYARRTWENNYSTYQSSAADLCGDANLELAVGNTVYGVNLQSRTDASMNQIFPVKTLPLDSMVIADGTVIPFTDGNTFLVDINLDGKLDVLALNVDHNNRVVYVYVWDVESQALLCSKKIPNSRKFGMPQIGDLDNDGYPEICFITGTYINHTPGNNETIYALKYNGQALNGEMDVFWTTPHSDFSGATSLTLFDFNQDGYSELVYRDETHLRIINGSLHHHQTGDVVTQPYDIATYACGSGTALEYPVVCDVDQDGAAEILIASSCISNSHYGHLYIFKSAGVPWAPARKVWNQYMYNVTNVNEDLTIPQYLFNNAMTFTDPEGVVRRPFNNFLQQATTIDQYGRPFYAVPDVAVNQTVSLQANGDSLLLSFSYCNFGDNTLNAPYPVTVFANTYGGNTVCTVTIGEGLPVDSCTRFDIHLPITSLCAFPNIDSLIVAVNCAGAGIAQNGNLQPECDTTNNTATVSISLHPDTTHLTETACDHYLWYGETLVLSGEYSHVLTNAAGCDSVVTLHLTINHSNTGDTSAIVCDSFDWYEQTNLTASGDYTRTVTNAAGCDSVVTLHLTINHSNTGDTTATVCDSFDWYEQTNLTVSGDYTRTVTNVAGCDSVVTLHLTVNHSNTGDTTATACDSFDWYEQMNLTVSGDYTRTVTNAAGCDSVVTLHLTVTPSVTELVEVAACGSYVWNGTTYNESGNYPQTFTAANGCDSIVTLHLTLYHDEYNVSDTAVCGSYLWHGQTCDTSGTYTYTYVSGNGCTIIDTLHLTVNHSNMGDTTAIACDSFDWYEQTNLTASGDYTRTVTNAAGCDSVVTLHLTIYHGTVSYDTLVLAENQLPYHFTAADTVIPSGSPTEFQFTYHLATIHGCDSTIMQTVLIHYNTSETHDTTVCAASLPYTWHGHVFTQAGSYVETLTNADGSDNVVTYQLAVSNPTVNIQNVSHIICYGESTGGVAVLVNGGTQPYNCHWENASGTTVSSNAQLTNQPVGNYVFYATDAIGCPATVTVTLNHLNDNMASGGIASNQEVCEGAHPAVFTGTAASGGAGSAYQWQISTDGNTWTAAPTPNNTQNYTYPNAVTTAFSLRRAWISSECGTVYSNVINVTVKPDYADTITDIVCQGHPYQENGFNITAEETAGTAMLVRTLNLQSVYGCDSVVTLMLSIRPAGHGDAYLVLCADELPYTYGDTVFGVGTPAHSVVNLKYSTPDGCDSVVALHLTINPVYDRIVNDMVCEGTGYALNGFHITPPQTVGVTEVEQTLNLQSHTGCDSTVTLHLAVVDTSISIVSLTDDFCEEYSAELSVVTNATSYMWSTGETDQTITVSQPGLYTVTAMQSECSMSAWYKIEVCEFNIYLPNAISPGLNDGMNDYFCIHDQYKPMIEEFEIRIFTRWGERVYYSNDKDFKWNGEHNGRINRNIIYTYIINIVDKRGIPYQLTGTITVL